jgi:hypothetical protein
MIHNNSQKQPAYFYPFLRLNANSLTIQYNTGIINPDKSSKRHRWTSRKKDLAQIKFYSTLLILEIFVSWRHKFKFQL